MKRKLFGIVWLVLLVATAWLFHGKFTDSRTYMIYGLEILFCGLALHAFLPRRTYNIAATQKKTGVKGKGKRIFFGLFIALVAVPLTIFCGIYFLGDKHPYLVSVLILSETILPFFVLFERKKAMARQLIVISVLCGLAVLGRTAFSWLPQFKPTLAIVILAGVAFGGEIGFFVGAMSAFVSNFFLGQGPWTPWQMFAMGVVGFLAGLLFQRGILPKKRWILCLIGGAFTLLLHGGILNFSSVLMMQLPLTMESVRTTFVMGLPYDLIHAAATVFFLWFAAEPMLEKLFHVQMKYGMLDANSI